MIALYQAIDEELTDRDGGEESPRAERINQSLKVGDTVLMGGARLWQVVGLETYSGEDQAVVLAMVHPCGEAVPDRANWQQTTALEDFPDFSLSVRVYENGTVAFDSFNVYGTPQVGRLSEWRPLPDSLEGEWYDLPLANTLSDTCKPRGAGSYAQIYVCDCSAAPLPALQLAI